MKLRVKVMRGVLSVLMVFVFTQSYAQSSFMISGQLTDASTGEVLPYSSAVLMNAPDSTVVKGVLTDENGRFWIETTPNDYSLKLEYIGYEPKFIDVNASQITDLNLGRIGLNLGDEEIEAVEVTGVKSETTYHLDKKVFTVGDDLIAVGTNAIDVLDNVPSVSTDVDGTVSLRGSEGVQILINGKPSGLTGLGSTNALKNLPANLIEKVEVITNPSARYDAQGQVGIINIVLKKQQEAGFNGSFDVNVGLPETYGGAVNMNYRKNKVNLFTSIGARKNVSPGKGFANYEYKNPQNGIFYSYNDRDFERTGLGLNGRMGLEYFIDERHSLTGSLAYSAGDDGSNTEIIYSNNDADNTPFHQILRTDDETEDEEDLQYSINYFFDIDKEKGKKITADFRYESTGETEGSDYLEKTILGDVTTPLQEKSLNEEKQGEYLFQVDYVNPFSKTKQLEFGAKSTLREINTDFTVERLLNGNYEVLPNLSNQFDYNEDIHAIYGQYADEVGRFSYQVGLRGEYTDIVTRLVETNEVNPRDYLSLFPSAFLTYNTETDNALQLSYSRRFRRPGFWHLNPFLTFSDARRRFSGNPNLNPEFTDSYELGYLKNWEKTTLNTALYYRKTQDHITRITIPVEADTVLIMPVNLNSSKGGGLEVTLNSDIAKWWTIDGNLNLFYYKEDGTNIGRQFEANDVTWMTRFSNRFRFRNDLSGQVRSFYRAPRNTTQGRSLGIFSTDIGMAKDVLNRKGTLSLNIRDITNSRKYRSEVLTDNFYSESEFQRRQRSFNFGFNYRINQNNKRRQQGGGRPGGGFEDGGGEF